MASPGRNCGAEPSPSCVEASCVVSAGGDPSGGVSPFSFIAASEGAGRGLLPRMPRPTPDVNEPRSTRSRLGRQISRVDRLALEDPIQVGPRGREGAGDSGHVAAVLADGGDDGVAV